RTSCFHSAMMSLRVLRMNVRAAVPQLLIARFASSAHDTSERLCMPRAVAPAATSDTTKPVKSPTFERSPPARRRAAAGIAHAMPRLVSTLQRAPWSLEDLVDGGERPSARLMRESLARYIDALGA